MMKALVYSNKPKQATRSIDKASQIKQKLRLFIIVFSSFMAAIFLIYGFYFLHRVDIFPIKEVSIQGEYEHVNAQALQNSILPFTQTSFFFLDLQGIKDKLLEQPWLLNAEVKKLWPGKLLVRLTEQKPVAVWNNQSLLNSSGVLFSPPAYTFPRNIPIFHAPNGQETYVISTYKHLSEQISVLGLTITECVLTPRLSWYLRLSNGLEVVLGKDELDKRITRFIEVYPQVFANRIRDINYIDLRYSNGLAVKWKNQPIISR